MLGYRSFFTVASDGEGTGIVPVVLAQVHSWLRSKKYTADLVVPGSVSTIGPAAEASLSQERGDDGSESILFQLREKNATGTWITHLVVHEPHRARRDAWVWLDIDGPEQARTAVPRLARALLDVLDARDGGAHLDATVRTIRADEIGELVAAISDEARRGPLFVAGSDDTLPLQPWRELVDDLLRQTTGLAAGYLLDAEATAAFAKIVGPTHSVSPGTMRTFVREVDFGDEVDGRRHRILTTRRIVTDSGRRVVAMLGARARDLTLSRPVPHGAARVEGRLLRAADRDFLSSLDRARVGTSPRVVTSDPDLAPEAPSSSAAVPPPAPEVVKDVLGASGLEARELDAARTEATLSRDSDADSREDVDAFLALRTVLEEVLGSDEMSVDAVLELGSIAQTAASFRSLVARKDKQTAALNDTVSDLRASHAEAQQQLDDEMAEHAQTTADLERVTAELHALRVRLQKQGDVALAWQPLDDGGSSSPESFADLLDRLDELHHVVWTGSEAVALGLEASDTMGTWAKKTWQALLCLDDYARSSLDGTFTGSVEHYLQFTPAGCHGFSANRHARDESEDVKNSQKFAVKRMLPVPTSADPSGVVFMGAHFKIAQFGLISPRMHYYDAVASDRAVYVGYIGPHLPTKQTN